MLAISKWLFLALLALSLLSPLVTAKRSQCRSHLDFDRHQTDDSEVYNYNSTQSSTGLEVSVFGSTVLNPEEIVETLKGKIDGLDTATQTWISGGYLGQKHCAATCPSAWAKTLYYSWSTKSHMKKLSSAITGEARMSEPQRLKALYQYDKGIANRYYGMMSTQAQRLTETIDRNFLVRTTLTMVLGPGGLIRRATGLGTSPCFFKYVLEGMVRENKYVPNKWSKLWWEEVVFPGCPDSPKVQNDTNVDGGPSPGLENMLEQVALSTGDETGINMEPAETAAAANAWASLPDVPEQCAAKLGRDGDWSKRLVSISKGMLTYKPSDSSSVCDPGFTDRLRAATGHKKTISLKLVSAVTDSASSQSSNASGTSGRVLTSGKSIHPPSETPHCTQIHTDFRTFVFCFADHANNTAFQSNAEAHRKMVRSALNEDIMDISTKTAKLAALAVTSGALQGHGDEEANAEAEIDAVLGEAVLSGPTAGSKVTAIGDAPAPEALQRILKAHPGDSRGAASIIQRFAAGAKVLRQLEQHPATSSPQSLAEMRMDLVEARKQMHQAYHDAHQHEALSHYLHSMIFCTQGGPPNPLCVMEFVILLTLLIIFECGTHPICLGAAAIVFFFGSGLALSID